MNNRLFMPLEFGRSVDSGEPVRIDPDELMTHLHLIGATGAGKTTAIHNILRQLMLMTGDQKGAIFVLDPMGNLSYDLLRLITDPKLVTDSVRERVVYIEPSREDVVMTFNPLHHTTEGHQYYQTMRAVDLVLRAWEAQDVASQPRLLNWTFKTFCAAAQLGLPISVCRHLVHPGTVYHEAIMRRIPPELASEWNEILRSKGEAVKILESTRNRLDPFFRSPSLRYMFGSNQSRFDCKQLIRDRRIVIINLASNQQVPNFICDTIGALVLNEIFESATTLTTKEGRSVVSPTYILLDEFQRYVSVDIENALPTVRQMGLRLILAHQSFAQLDRGDLNLEQMIWQARSRLVYASYAKDADLLSDEMAKITFDKMRIKHVQKTVRQLINGYRKEWLNSYSSSSSSTSSSSEIQGRSDGSSVSRYSDNDTVGYGENTGRNSTQGSTLGGSSSNGSGSSEAMVPIHKTFEEVTGITYETFLEQSLEWGKAIRTLGRGEAFLQLPGQTRISKIKIPFLPPESERRIDDRIHEFKENNFASDFFVSAEAAKIEHEQILESLLTDSPIVIDSQVVKPSQQSPFEL